MDRRSLVIMVVIGSELILRLVYQHLLLPGHPLFASTEAQLLYTACARALQAAVIFSLAFDGCGIKTRSLGREVLVGIGVSLAFGALVLLSDLAVRTALQGGWLTLVLGRQAVSSPVLFFLVGCVFGPFVEELFFRGVLYAWIRERMPAAPAIVLSALIFAGLHPGFAVQFMGGLLFASIFEWRRNIWAAYVVHAAANFGIWIVPWIHPLW